MKVVITVPWARRLGGAETMLWTLLRQVDRSRLQPLVVFFERGPFEREVAALGHGTMVIPAGRLRQAERAAAAVRRLAGALRGTQPDVLLNWSPKTHLYGAAAAALARVPCPVVWWQHGVTSGHWMDRLATLLPASAVGCSSGIAARQQAGLRPRRRTFVVYPGIESPHLSASAARVALRRRLNIPEHGFVAGIVGRLEPTKGQHHFIRALADLRRRGHDVHGLVVGGTAYDLSPEYEPSLRALVDELGLQSVVTFTGQAPDAGPYIDLMDVLVSASAVESFGIVLVEAMARGVSVVAVDAAGPAEIVQPGRSGLLVERPDPLLLAGAIESLVVDLKLREQIAAGGRARYEAAFTARRMTDQLIAKLNRVRADGGK